MSYVVVITAADRTPSAAGPFRSKVQAEGFAASVELASTGEYGGIAVELENPADVRDAIGA